MTVFSCDSNIKGLAVVQFGFHAPQGLFSLHTWNSLCNEIGKSFTLVIALETTGASFEHDYSFPLRETPFFLS